MNRLARLLASANAMQPWRLAQATDHEQIVAAAAVQAVRLKRGIGAHTSVVVSGKLKCGGITPTMVLQRC
jgi:hypothetical protein